MDYKDYYASLGVSKTAAKDEIQRAYRKLARKYHPDVNRTPEAEKRFKEINEAYEVLRDPEKRARYDRFGSAWNRAQTSGQPPPGFEDIFTMAFGGRPPSPGFSTGEEGFSSFFEMLFGGAGGTRQAWSPGGRGAAAPPQDRQARLALTLEEAAHGGQREIQIEDPSTGGRRTLRVNIPRGVRPGQRIRLAGQGGVSPGSDRRGSLYLTVELLPHPQFRLEGTDVYTVLPVTPWEAALGGQARIATLDGHLTVKIPAGISSGRKIRLRGRGFPRRGGGRGDLLAEIRIHVPEKLSSRERELFEKLAASSDFKVRG